MGKHLSKDHTGFNQKIQIRKLLLSKIESPHILDCFAGKGDIRKSIYSGLPYFGIDKRKMQNDTVVGDTRKILRGIELGEYNFFDIDAHGSPWYPFWIIANLRKSTKGEILAFALTNGAQYRPGHAYGMESGLKTICNIPATMKIPCLNRHKKFIVNHLINIVLKKKCYKINYAIRASNHRWRSDMDYFGIILEKT